MKKYAVLCACGLAAAMVFSGCGKKDDTKDTTPAQTEATSEAETSEDLEIKGDVKLGEYKNIEVTKQNTTVTDEELQTTVDSYIKANPDYVEVDRPAKEGDTVNIDYVGMKDGVAFEGGTAEGQDLVLGSGSFIDGFEEGLIGATKGQELSLDLTFPEEYPNNPDLAGKAVVFDVTVNTIEEKHDAVLNDDFVKKVSNEEFTDVDSWKEDLRSQLVQQKEDEAKTMKQSEILQAVVEGSEFSGIEESVKAQYEQQLSQSENMAAIYGMKLADIAAMYQMEEQEYKDFLYTQVENSVKIQLVLKEIAKQENIQVTDEDRQKVAEENQAESVEQLLEQLGEGGEKALDDYALNEKVLEFLESSAVEK
ncbi:trigger factor [Clostridium sp. AM58-1XD]|uniref:trigger factor n=1 Tax=Clostridium sp. AM58-1XD TaxID=2292307 RepID=UPI000E551A1F|nr:trigger factor [Clostridium sp. AM58-1XD]RGY99226.1 trigger factor [Clostridium sp. AM58-1XD]